MSSSTVSKHSISDYPYLRDFPVETVDLRVTQCPAVRVVAAHSVHGTDPGEAFAVHLDALRGGDAAELELDFGSERVGYLRGTIDSPKPVTIRIRYGETREELDTTPANELSWFKFPSDHVVCDAGETVIASAGRRAFRFLRLTVTLVADEQTPGTQPDVGSAAAVAVIRGLHVEHAHYPVSERGRFRCSDPLLERAWSVGAETVKLCMQQFYEDGIKRDGLLWIGDTRVECMCNYYAFGDSALVLKSLRMMAASQRADGAIPACAGLAGGHQHPEIIDYMPGVTNFVSTWILHNYGTDFISMLWEFTLFTGRIEETAELWPTAKRLRAYLERTVRLPEPETENIIITDDNIAAPDTWWASPGAFLGQLAVALGDMSRLAGIMGDANEQKLADAFRTRVAQTLRSHYLRAQDGLFTNRSDSDSDTGYHVTAFAALAGMYDSSEASAAAFAKLPQLPEEAVRQPIVGFMRYWSIHAMARFGACGPALEMLRNYWGFMLGHDATTFWEKLDLKRPERVLGNPTVSRCHGWSGGPVALLSEHILGVTPVAPGFKTVQIRPWLGDLDWAAGSIPTPHGEIQVRWKKTSTREGGARIQGEVELPPEVNGHVVLETGHTVALKGGVNRIKDIKKI